MIKSFFERRYNSNASNAFRNIFNSKNSSADIVLRDIIKISKYNESSVGKTNEETYFNEGMKHVVRYMLQMSARLSNETLLEMEEHLKNQFKK